MPFDEIIITVTDLDAAIGFYTEACGFTFVRTVAADDVGRVAELDADGQRVTLVPGAQGGISLVLPTRNVRAEHRRLSRRGAAVDEEGPVELAGGRWLPFRDPSGNSLAYWQTED